MNNTRLFTDTALTIERKSLAQVLPYPYPYQVT